MKKAGESIYNEIHDESKSVFRILIASPDLPVRWEYETSILLFCKKRHKIAASKRFEKEKNSKQVCDPK